MSSINTPWFASTIGLAGLIVGYGLATGMNGLNLPMAPAPTLPSVDQQVPTPPPSNDTPAEVDDDPMQGSDSAQITLIEFTDYQCPFCSRHFTQTYSQIKKDYIDTGKVKHVVRDFPLSFHGNAQKASEATECADDQGKFWEMHNKLFTAQGEWSNASDAPTMFKRYAAEFGVDTETFDSCLDNGTHAQEVKNDLADGSKSGIDGTPGFWILGPDGTGKKISGAYPYDSFKAAFDELL